MKPNISLAKAALVAGLLVAAAPLLAKSVASGAGAKPSTGNAAAAAPTTTQPAEPKIDGIVIPRAKGGFLGLTLDGGNFKLAFYGANKLPVSVDVTRAAARWPVHYRPYEERTMLNPTADGMALISANFIRPPYAFKLSLTLIVEGSAQPPESYVVDFQQ